MGLQEMSPSARSFQGVGLPESSTPRASAAVRGAGPVGMWGADGRKVGGGARETRVSSHLCGLSVQALHGLFAALCCLSVLVCEMG